MFFFEALQEGDRPIRANMTLTLFSPTEEASISSVSNARTYFKELGFELMEDKYFCLPIFLNALPFGADRRDERLVSIQDHGDTACHPSVAFVCGLERHWHAGD